MWEVDIWFDFATETVIYVPTIFRSSAIAVLFVFGWAVNVWIFDRVGIPFRCVCMCVCACVYAYALIILSTHEFHFYARYYSPPPSLPLSLSPSLAFFYGADNCCHSPLRQPSLETFFML